MPELWFVMPAYRRYDLSSICFEQRRRLCEALGANCVVIADDVNLDIARAKGFDVVECDNQYLGKRFNEGHEYAFKHGATHTVPVGSDMWILPKMFENLLDQFSTNISYAITEPFGEEMLALTIPWGVLQIFPRKIVEKLGFRPCLDDIKRRCDMTSRERLEIDDSEIRKYTVDPLEVTSFQSGKTQMTKSYNLKREHPLNKRVLDLNNITVVLRAVFDNDLVDRIEEYYKTGLSQIS